MAEKEFSIIKAKDIVLLMWYLSQNMNKNFQIFSYKKNKRFLMKDFFLIHNREYKNNTKYIPLSFFHKRNEFIEDFDTNILLHKCLFPNNFSHLCDRILSQESIDIKESPENIIQ